MRGIIADQSDMDIDDFDVVVTGTSPQRSTLREAQAREAPARANCSKLKIQADVRVRFFA